MIEITASQLKDLMQSNDLYAVLDVRDFGEFYLAHIPWANSLPRGALEFRADTLLPHKNVNVVVYGRADQLREACETLEALGYSRVSFLKGGFSSWKDAGFAIMSGSNTPGKEYAERVYVQRSVPSLTVKEYIARRSQGEMFYCIDPRPEPDFLTSHLPGSYNIPGGEIPFEVTDIARVRQAKILVVCGGRTRGILGAFILQKMGVTNAYVLDDGLGAWRIAGHECEAGAGQPRSPASETSIAIGIDFAEQLAKEENIKFLSLDEVKAQLDRGDVIYMLDARLPNEYSEWHIESSVNLPAGQVSNSVEDVVAVRNATLVTISQNRARAIIAAFWLKEIGYPHVYVLDGGIRTWAKRRLPIRSGGMLVTAVPRLETAQQRVTFISVQELKAKLDSGDQPLLVDERSIGAFGTSHIPGARWVSRSYLTTDITTEVPDRDTSFIVYCDDSRTSALSILQLEELGYANVVVLEGGVDAWCKAGYPLEIGLRDYQKFEEVAVAEAFITRRGGPYSYTNERMQKYLDEEKALGNKYR